MKKCKKCDCKCNLKMSHMMLATVLAIGAIALTPGVSGEYSKNVMSSVMIAEDNAVVTTDSTMGNSMGNSAGSTTDSAGNSGSSVDGTTNSAGNSGSSVDGTTDSSGGSAGVGTESSMAPATETTDSVDSTTDSTTDSGDYNSDGFDDNTWDNSDWDGTTSEFSCAPDTHCCKDGKPVYTNSDGTTKDADGNAYCNENGEVLWDDSNWDNGNSDNGNWDNQEWEDSWTWEEQGPNEEDCKWRIMDTRRLKRETQQLLKRAKREGGDYSHLETLYDLADQYHEKAETCTSMTWDEYHSMDDALHGENGIQTQISWYWCMEEYNRIAEDIEREEMDREREEEDFDRMEIEDEAVKGLMEEHLERRAQIIELLKEQRDLYEQYECNFQNDPDLEWERQELQWDLHDLWDADRDFWREFEKAKMSIFAKQMFEDILSHLDNFECPAGDQKCEKMKEVAYRLVEKGESCLADGHYKCVEKVQWKLDELRRRAAMYLRMDVDIDPESFGMGGMEGVAMEVLKEVMGFDSAKIERIFNSAIKDKLSNVVKHMHVDESFINNMDEWSQITEEIEENGDKQFTKKFQMNPLFGEAAEKFKANLEDYRDGKLTEEELRQEYEQRVEESIQEEKGMGGFEDASFSNGDYWAEAVHNLDLSGRVENGQMKYVPEGETLVAEAFKIVWNATGKGEVGQTDPWYQGFIDAARNKGIDVSFVEANAGRPITRAEVLEMIVKVNGMAYMDGTVPFSDVPSTHKYYKAIATGYMMGITTGNPDGTFNPNGTINRADIAAMASRMTENDEIFSYSATEEDFEDLVKDIDTFDDEVWEDDLWDMEETDEFMDNITGMIRES